MSSRISFYVLAVHNVPTINRKNKEKWVRAEPEGKKGQSWTSESAADQIGAKDILLQVSSGNLVQPTV